MSCFFFWSSSEPLPSNISKRVSVLIAQGVIVVKLCCQNIKHPSIELLQSFDCSWWAEFRLVHHTHKTQSSYSILSSLYQIKYKNTTSIQTGLKFVITFFHGCSTMVSKLGTPLKTKWSYYSSLNVLKGNKCSSSKSAGEETNILQVLMVNQKDDDQQVREALKFRWNWLLIWRLWLRCWWWRWRCVHLHACLPHFHLQTCNQSDKYLHNL